MLSHFTRLLSQIKKTPQTMDFKTLNRYSHINLSPNFFSNYKHSRHHITLQPCSNQTRVQISTTITKTRKSRFRFECVTPGQDLVSEKFEFLTENGEAISSIVEEKEIDKQVVKQVLGETESIWNQMFEIVKFSGPATALWLCGPLMSLIDTVVIGQSSSVELAALGPGTVLCDNMSYVFMFLSIATSNFVATALAAQDKNEVQHQISILLFVGLTCGVFMFFFTRFFGEWALTAFTGAKNVEIISSANTYVQIRGLAWPAVLLGWVAQSASLGMKDSWGPLKALAVATAINGIGDVVLCSFLGYGIAGAAWATMASQVVAGYMMVDALNHKGYNGFALSVPSFSELQHIYSLAAPVFITMTSKVAFYSLLVYFATSMGIQKVAAHQVMIQVYCLCTVWGEPLSQTAQSFMPELMYGANRNLSRARMLLKNLVIIGALTGLVLGCIGTSVPWFFPQAFSPDADVIREMHKVVVPYFIALIITPSTHSLEGTLLAGRDLKFISMSMSGIFTIGALVLLLLSGTGYGLAGCWWALAAFQWSRFSIALRRLTSRDGLLFSDDLTAHKFGFQSN